MPKIIWQTNKQRSLKMAQVKLDLSANTAYTGRTVLPTGIYNMEITRADVKETKAGGHMLEVDCTVMDGEHQSKIILERINIQHTNEKVVKYGLNQIKTILTVGGHSNPNFLADTDEMIGLKLRLSVEENIQMKDGQPVTDDNGKPYRENKVKGTFKYDDSVGSTSSEKVEAEATPSAAPSSAPAPTPSPAPAADAPAPAAQASGSFPWNS